MGQYHYVVNLDKKQYLHAHRFGEGIKLMEFGRGQDGTMTALAVLLAAQNGRGGGDCRSADAEKLIGSWAGDRIVIAGDYASATDAQGWDAEHDCSLQESCQERFEDISRRVAKILEADGCQVNASI